MYISHSILNIMKSFYLKDIWIHSGKDNEKGQAWCDGHNFLQY